MAWNMQMSMNDNFNEWQLPINDLQSALLATNSHLFKSRFPYFLETLCLYLEKYRHTSVVPADFRTNTAQYGRVGRSDSVHTVLTCWRKGAHSPVPLQQGAHSPVPLELVVRSPAQPLGFVAVWVMAWTTCPSCNTAPCCWSPWKSNNNNNNHPIITIKMLQLLLLLLLLLLQLPLQEVLLTAMTTCTAPCAETPTAQ